MAVTRRLLTAAAVQKAQFAAIDTVNNLNHRWNDKLKFVIKDF